MKTKQLLTRKRSEHVEELLDEALAETFPASDPIAVSPPRAVRDAKGQPTADLPPHSGVT